MKVIVVKDKATLGEIGEVVNVRDGYARNYLLPRKMVIEATPQNLKTWEVVKKQRAKKNEKTVEEKKQLRDMLNGKEVKTIVETGQAGKLYGSVSNFNVAALIKEQLDLDIDRHRIILSQKHIKDVGNHAFQVKIYPEIVAEMKLIIEGKLKEEPEDVMEDKKEKEKRGRRKKVTGKEEPSSAEATEGKKKEEQKPKEEEKNKEKM